jgi:hypothetical protein
MTVEAVIECIKDMTRPDYKDQKMKDKIWNETGKKLHVMS